MRILRRPAGFLGGPRCPAWLLVYSRPISLTLVDEHPRDPSLPEPFTPHSGAPGMGRVASGAGAAGGAQAHTPTLSHPRPIMSDAPPP